VAKFLSNQIPWGKTNRPGLLYYLWQYVKRGKGESASVIGEKRKKRGGSGKRWWLGDEEERDR
jgi:hypothetical protein